ncbi:MAG TPA: hypothetical protein PLP34_09100, partial [Chitinophagaceae bacterium]|nr:hypothetical protein [Chitinophagaceae bacterium]
RYTLSASGNKTIYNTAAIDLNRESNFIFSKKVPLNIDTLSIENHQTHTWNLMLCIVFPVKSWEVECRFDVLGFSSGSRKQATLQYGEEGEAIRKGSVIPAPRNLLLLGDNNRGTLNATLGVKHKLKHSWFGEFGLQYLRNEYQFDRPVQYKNSIGQSIFTDRYRAVTLGAMIGLVYSLKK